MRKRAAFAGDGRTHLFQHVVQRFQGSEHGIDVVIAVEQARSLLQAFMPELVPQDGDADELLTDEDGLLDESGAVVPHSVHDRQRSAPSSFAWVLGGDRQRVDECLRVRAADVGQDVLDQLANARIRSVDACNQLESYKKTSARPVQESGRLGRLTCGMTSSHVSTETDRKPSMIAVDTSATCPYLNQRVKRRSVSWSALSGERAIERKKARNSSDQHTKSASSLAQGRSSPCTAGTRWTEYACGFVGSCSPWLLAK